MMLLLCSGRVLLFLAVPALYVVLGWLHWHVGGKVALLGGFAVTAVSAWTIRDCSESKVGKFCVLLTAACFFAMFGFHAFLRDLFGVGPDDNNVISALFGTDRAEAAEFIDQYAGSLAKHFLAVVLTLTIFASLVWRKPTPTNVISKPLGRLAWISAVVISVGFILLHTIPSLRSQNPVLYFPLQYSAWKARVEAARQFQANMIAARTDPGLESLRCNDPEPRTIVVVLGESITRWNLPLAGYPRNTTPELDAMGSELIWFPDVISSAPSTTASLAKMLTPATLAQPSLWRTKPDVLTIAKKAGYKTFWLSNHSTDRYKLLSVFASHADRVVIPNKGGSRGEGAFDEIVLPSLEGALSDPAARKLIVLHLLNGHPAYHFRYPDSFAKFNDAEDGVTKKMKADGRSAWAINMRNFYDNAVLYTDHVLKRSLDLCRKSGQRLAWIYVPDHGQDAAHKSNFAGHNFRARSQYEILMIYWRSQSFPAPIVDTATLRARPYQTDVFDQTILGLLSISGDYYDARGDIFSEGFEPQQRTIDSKPYFPGSAGWTVN